jgi:hypothetical protein
VATVIHKQGISEEFSGNSVRHATISEARKLVKSTVGVNAFTGHSNNATTILDYYYHQNGNWLGFRLAQLTGEGPRVVAVPDETQQLMENDDAEATHEGEIGVESGQKMGLDLFGALEPKADMTALEQGSGSDEEIQDASPRAEATEVVAGGPEGLRRPGLDSYRAIGPSTTLTKVGLTRLFKVRRVGGSTNVACHYGASPYPSTCKRQGRRIFVSARPVPSKLAYAHPSEERVGRDGRDDDVERSDDGGDDEGHRREDDKETGR